MVQGKGKGKRVLAFLLSAFLVLPAGVRTAFAAGGWVSDEGTWKYTNESGISASSWLLIENSWYYFDSSNVRMVTGWLRAEDGSWYYLNPAKGKDEGKMVTGWFQDTGGAWYFLDTRKGAAGSMMVSRLCLWCCAYSWRES